MKKSVLHNVFLQKKERVHIAVEKYLINLDKAEGVTFFILENGGVRERLDAKSMTWNDSTSTWNISSFSFRKFDDF